MKDLMTHHQQKNLPAINLEAEAALLRLIAAATSQEVAAV